MEIKLLKSNVKTNAKGRQYNEYECYYGNTFIADPYKIKVGHTKSCGCYQKLRAKEASLKHGMEKSPEYSTWERIKQRCHNTKNPNYDNYGGRGITVCDKWINSFDNFYADMGNKPFGTSIDRINNNGNYEPSNCRWATRSQQMKNRRPRSEWKRSKNA